MGTFEDQINVYNILLFSYWQFIILIFLHSWSGISVGGSHGLGFQSFVDGELKYAVTNVDSVLSCLSASSSSDFANSKSCIVQVIKIEYEKEIFNLLEERKSIMNPALKTITGGGQIGRLLGGEKFKYFHQCIKKIHHEWENVTILKRSI